MIAEFIDFINAFHSESALGLDVSVFSDIFFLIPKSLVVESNQANVSASGSEEDSTLVGHCKALDLELNACLNWSLGFDYVYFHEFEEIVLFVYL